MSFQPPTDDEVRELLLEAPNFHWPTFDHMPLNCFDMSSALLSFPGKIATERDRAPSRFADYHFDIDDIETCPRIYAVGDIEIWNYESLSVRWLMGLLQWACAADADGYVLQQGFFTVGVSALRFQNIKSVNDVTELNQLQHALFVSLQEQVESGSLSPFAEDSIFRKQVNDRSWLVCRSTNSMGYPAFEIVSPIDFQTAINISATIGNCWFQGEVVPEKIVQRHLASLWDYLAHVNLHPVHDNEVEIGTVAREAPGQAEKMDDELPEW